eukprot:gene8947-18509_t
MSICNTCLQGLCRRHPSQDHGQRASKIVSEAKSIAKESLKRTYNEMIRAQIERLDASARGTSAVEIDEYREQMQAERLKAENKQRKKLSQDHLDLANNTGLHASVLSVMLADSDDESSSEASLNTTSEQEELQRKKKKKSKKEKKSKKAKKEKKEKKARRTEGKSSSKGKGDRPNDEGSDS